MSQDNIKKSDISLEENEDFPLDPNFEPETDENRPVQEVYGSITNIERHGAPSAHQEAHIRYYFYPTWRSQLLPLVGFVLISMLCVYLSGLEALDFLTIPGPLYSSENKVFFLHLPILIVIPGFILAKILIYMYDSKYIIDERGVEAQIGLVSFSLRQPRLRYEDIRGVEPVQTLWERMLGIGSVMIGSAMTQDIEIVMEGVANPRGIQLLIGGERDKRLRELQREGVAATVAVTGD